MTAFADDPMLAHLCDQTDRLLSTINALTDDDVRAVRRGCRAGPAGHVLTHLARNADGLANVARTAITGQVTPMYASPQQRDADIEAGAHRSASELESDVEASAERLLALLADVPAGLRSRSRCRAGADRPSRSSTLPWVRTREVVYHHVDLGRRLHVRGRPRGGRCGPGSPSALPAWRTPSPGRPSR